MLKDRRVLLEEEINKLKKEAAYLYFEIAINGHQLNAQYKDVQRRLLERRNDLQSVNYLIEVEGKE
jgi:hypothetical protein